MILDGLHLRGRRLALAQNVFSEEAFLHRSLQHQLGGASAQSKGVLRAVSDLLHELADHLAARAGRLHGVQDDLVRSLRKVHTPERRDPLRDGEGWRAADGNGNVRQRCVLPELCTEPGARPPEEGDVSRNKILFVRALDVKKFSPKPVRNNDWQLPIVQAQVPEAARAQDLLDDAWHTFGVIGVRRRELQVLSHSLGRGADIAATAPKQPLQTVVGQSIGAGAASGAEQPDLLFERLRVARDRGAATPIAQRNDPGGARRRQCGHAADVLPLGPAAGRSRARSCGGRRPTPSLGTVPWAAFGRGAAERGRWKGHGGALNATDA
mmetsp:Transcript_122328/g.351456  ORF Transcript_122328/g.351456 Transcript_122328/m.351456 type:complete len:324 (+) Transcript_122328:840-1811(+)